MAYPQLQLVVTVDTQGLIMVWNTETGSECASFSLPTSCSSMEACDHPEGPFLLVSNTHTQTHRFSGALQGLPVSWCRPVWWVESDSLFIAGTAFLAFLCAPHGMQARLSFRVVWHQLSPAASAAVVGACCVSSCGFIAMCLCFPVCRWVLESSVCTVSSFFHSLQLFMRGRAPDLQGGPPTMCFPACQYLSIFLL